MCLIFFLGACGKDSNDNDVIDKNAKEVIWEIKPTLDFDYVVYPNILERDAITHDYQIREYVGYPCFSDYRNDAIFTVKDKVVGIYDYAGNLLNDNNEKIIEGYGPYVATGAFKDGEKYGDLINVIANYKYDEDIPELVDKYITNRYWPNGVARGIKDETGKAMQKAVYASDLSSFRSLVPTGFGDGGYPMPMWVINGDEIINSGLVRYDDEGKLYLEDFDSLHETNQAWVKEIDGKNANKNLLLPILSEEPFYSPETSRYYSLVSGLANYNFKTKEIRELDYTYVHQTYINGFYAVTDQKPNTGRTLVQNRNFNNNPYEDVSFNAAINDNFFYTCVAGDNALFGFVNARTNEPITAIEYQDLLYFNEGIGAVKKDKWAFINEKGELLSDFIFEDVTPIIDGKSYVKVNGYYGILNLKETLAKKIPLKAENLKVETVKEGEFKLPLAYIYPRVDSVRIRADHSLESDVVGYFGFSEDIQSAYIYDVFETEYYRWYKIGEDAWVASVLDETWYYQNVNKKINIDAWN